MIYLIFAKQTALSTRLLGRVGKSEHHRVAYWVTPNHLRNKLRTSATESMYR